MNLSMLTDCNNPKLIIYHGPPVSQANADSLPAISPLQKKMSAKEDEWGSPRRKTAMMGQVRLLLEMHLIMTQ